MDQRRGTERNGAGVRIPDRSDSPAFYDPEHPDNLPPTYGDEYTHDDNEDDEMTDYQAERQERRERLAAMVDAVLVFLPEWNREPLDSDPSWGRCRLEAPDGFRLEAVFSTPPGYIVFDVAAWPRYINETGNPHTVTPNDLREVGPVTKARLDRAPEAIAKQVQRKVIEPGRLLYAKLKERADSNQAHCDRNKAASVALGEALGDPRDPKRLNNYFSARNIPGNGVYIEFRGASDVLMRGIPVEDAIVMLAALREYRTAKLLA